MADILIWTPLKLSKAAIFLMINIIVAPEADLRRNTQTT